MKYIFMVMTLSSCTFAMDKQDQPKPVVKVPGSLLKIIFEARELDDITRLINRTIDYDPALQRFMQLPENVDALIAHIRRKTNATEPIIALKLRAINFLKRGYNNGSISQKQMVSIINNAFESNDIRSIAAVINAIPPLSNIIFDTIEKTPILIRALQYSDGLPLVIILIDNGADVNKTDATGMSPLIYAVKYGRTEALQKILAAGANVNKKTSLNSPLFYAVQSGYVQGVKLLLDAGAVIDEETLDLINRNNNLINREEILKILQDKKANQNIKFTTFAIKL